MQSMNRRQSLFAIGSFALAVTLPAEAYAGEALVVIVHKDNPVQALSRAQLESIFKVRTTKFPGGARATPVNLPIGHPARVSFDEVVLGLPAKEVERYWIDSKIRTGNGPPQRLATPSTVLHYVSSETDAIGYVPVGDLGPGVRAVARVYDGRVARKNWIIV